MKETPTPEQLDKLPKWAQEHIASTERRATDAERTLREYLDNQTPTEFYVDDYRGGGIHKNYIQTYKMTVERGGIIVRINLREDEKGVDISWESKNRLVREIAVVATGFNQIRVLAKEDMR